MRRFAAVVLVVAMGIVPVTAFGDARAQRREAQAAFVAGDTETALARVTAGLALAPKDLDLLLLRGHVLLKMSDYPAALAAYEAYLAAGATGGNRREVQRIVANLKNVTNTFLDIQVTNGPAQVFLDGNEGRPFCVATPSCKKGVVPGEHIVSIRRDGFNRATQRVAIEPASTVRVEKTLVEKNAPLALRVEPSDARVTINDTPLAGRKELPPGQYVISITKPGYLARTETIQSALGAPIELSVALFRGVAISLTPADARVEVDGQSVQLVGGALPLPAGSGPHQVVARAEGHREARAEVPAELPSDYRLTLTLARLGVRLSVTGAPAGAELFVDGTARARLPLREPIEIESGPHDVEIRADGFLPFHENQALPPGGVATVRIRELRKASKKKAWLFTTLSGGALATGAIFGGLALSKSSQYDDLVARPGVARDDPAALSLKDTGEQYALFADVAFGVSAAALATGIVFFLTEGRGESEGGIEIGPGSVSVSGRF